MKTYIDLLEQIFYKSHVSHLEFHSCSKFHNLEQEIRSSSTYSSFKSKLSDKNKQVKISNIYCIGNRYISVLHVRLKNNCSHLNEEWIQCATVILGSKMLNIIFSNAIVIQISGSRFFEQQGNSIL